MVLATFYFQLHQPLRLHPDREKFIWDEKNKEIFEKVTRKCYIPATKMFVELIKNDPNFKLTLSMSGTFLEQAENCPDVYTHTVLSHAFMEYAGVRGLFKGVKKRIKKEKGSFDPRNEHHNKLYWKYLKQDYLDWARQNNLPKNLLEEGWQEFLND